MYFKGEHNLAAEKYTQTIGYLEPSYVIHKLLDAQRIESLTLYLEQLQVRGVSRSEHRNLLISCYAKCKDEQKLKELLEQSESTSSEGIGKFFHKFWNDHFIKELLSMPYFDPTSLTWLLPSLKSLSSMNRR